jgi:hypothetical protein
LFSQDRVTSDLLADFGDQIQYCWGNDIGRLIAVNRNAICD